MIHNLATFNRHYLAHPPYFRMTRLLQSRIQAHDTLLSLDIQDVSLHVLIHPDDRKFLRFIFRGVHYQLVVLPFGISLAL